MAKTPNVPSIALIGRLPCVAGSRLPSTLVGRGFGGRATTPYHDLEHLTLNTTFKCQCIFIVQLLVYILASFHIDYLL